MPTIRSYGRRPDPAAVKQAQDAERDARRLAAEQAEAVAKAAVASATERRRAELDADAAIASAIAGAEDARRTAEGRLLEAVRRGDAPSALIDAGRAAAAERVIAAARGEQDRRARARSQPR